MADLREDLQIITGGWVDAKNSDLDKEWFTSLRLEGHIHDIIVPYVRSSHVKIELSLGPEASIVSGRLLQKNVIDALKRSQFKSKIPCQEEYRIWITLHRTLEERNRVKAVVSVKEFMSADCRGY